jgi:hypothetical protein
MYNFKVRMDLVYVLPYSTDMTVNGYTIDIDDDELSAPHGVGLYGAPSFGILGLYWLRTVTTQHLSWNWRK